MEAPAAAPERAWARVRAMAFSAGACDPALPTAAFDFDSTLRPYRGSGPPEALTRRFRRWQEAQAEVVAGIVPARATEGQGTQGEDGQATEGKGTQGTQGPRGTSERLGFDRIG